MGNTKIITCPELNKFREVTPKQKCRHFQLELDFKEVGAVSAIQRIFYKIK
jgi:hypothetical protein